MRVVRRPSARGRKGKILIMTALLTPVLFGAALISTDTAVLSNAEAQLKTAADASALAAAMSLAGESRLTGTATLTALMSAARTKAISVAGKNSVLGSPVLLNDNPSNSTSGDVMVGYLSPTDSTSTSPSSTVSQALFNSIMVTARRDATHGGQIPTFFGGPLGIGNQSMSVSTIATVRNYSVRGLKSVNNQSVNLLPITMDKTTYDAMIGRSLTSDQYSYNTTTGAVSAGSDGVPESQLYPVGTGNPGNFGTVKIGNVSNGTSVLVDQITNGISPSQIANYPNGRIELDSALNPPSITFNGNPGISAGMKNALTAQIGKTKIIPIYDTTGGNGANSYYRIVAFAPVRIMAVNFSGSQKYVVVQPALLNDPSIVTGSVQTSWTNGGAVRVYLSR